MSKKDNTRLVKTGENGDYEQFAIMPSSVADTLEATSAFISAYGGDTAQIFQTMEDDSITNPIKIGGKEYRYVPWGGDNTLPYQVQELIGRNMVTAQCQQFNIATCYGQGMRFIDRQTKERASDEQIRNFCLRNALHLQFWEQVTDMKYYNFSVMIVTLSRDASKIVQLRHVDACHCRFTARNAEGKREHVIVANWRMVPEKASVYPLLDEVDPLGDLYVRLGLEPDPATGSVRNPTSERTFAIKSMVPTIGQQTYPIPYYFSIFMDSWYDIYRLIGTGKKFMIKNTAAPRIQVEIHKNYWMNVCNEEGIKDPVERKKRIKQERENIKNFCTKPENAGKAWVTSYDSTLDGKETRMVRVYTLGADKKEGGNWSEDMGEAANSLCFAMGVHPNMVGATPGKSQMNNSGSDKRELFNLKQAIEKPWHDVMEVPYHVVMHFNKWDEKYDIVIPVIEMTTLDKNKEFTEKVENNEVNNQ